MTGLGYHYGKTMIQIAGEPGGNHAYLLNSSVPQRPPEAAAVRSYGGRPLGPCSYDIPRTEGKIMGAHQNWIKDATTPMASFASKTQKMKEKPPVTAEVDFLTGNPDKLLDMQRQVPPGFYAYTWGNMEQRPVDKRDVKLDKVYDVNYGVKIDMQSQMEQSSRLYAASFNSQDRRFKQQKESHDMAPGSYDCSKAPGYNAINIKDPKKPTYPFKSQTDYSSINFKTAAKNEPPDAIHTPLFAQQAAAWTSKGFAFSTRERFPRVRSTWKS